MIKFNKEEESVDPVDHGFAWMSGVLGPCNFTQVSLDFLRQKIFSMSTGRMPFSGLVKFLAQKE